MIDCKRTMAAVALALTLVACEDDGVGPDRDDDAPRFVRVAAGDFHTCALRDDGVVYCWGFNDTGALGVAPGVSDGTPVRVPLADPVESIVARGGATCALARGEAWCWGSVPGGSSTPARVGPGIEWASITPAQRYEHAYLCGVSVGGDAYCWGAEGPHLGLGPDGAADQPALVAGGDWRTIGAHRFPANSNFYPGAATSCATKADGRAYCWGFVSTGEADDDVPTRPLHVVADTPLLIDSTLTFATLLPGSGYVCGIVDSAATYPGRVYCFGTLGVTTYPAMHGTDFYAQRIATGAMHACRVDEPWLSCWGRNDQGQLGSGDRVDDAAGDHVEPSRAWADVAAGAAHTCGVTSSGEIYCWGAGGRYQMGDGWQEDRLRPVRVHIPEEA